MIEADEMERVGGRASSSPAACGRRQAGDVFVPGTTDMIAAAGSISIIPLRGMPLVAPGDNLAGLISSALATEGLVLQDHDILVVTQKVVSKAEDRYVDLASVTPSPQALELAGTTGKDPRHVELILSESTEIIRHGPRLIIVAHRLGFVMANAGIDESNIEHGPAGERVLLLPRDPDRAAAELREHFEANCAASLGVVISDSFGRPWRNGVTGVAIGAAGLPSLVDMVGKPDLFGRPLQVTEIAVADQIAAAATLLMGEADEGVPVVIVRGYAIRGPHRPASAILRPRERDMFR